MRTHVVNIKAGAEYDVYIGRAGRGEDGYFGNPFSGLPRGESLDRFAAYFDDRVRNDPEYRRRVLELRGKVLGCFCRPKSCHGDVIAAWLNNQEG